MVYGCPSIPEVVSEVAGHRPKCAMKLLPPPAADLNYACPMPPEVVRATPAAALSVPGSCYPPS